MSFQARRELLTRVASRYRESDPKQKTVILDEFVASTGYARKYAIKLLTQPVLDPPPAVIHRPREPAYGREIQEALVTAWQAANGICAKRLIPFLPELVATLERHGHLDLREEVRTQLLAISPATADRLLRPLRQQNGGRGFSTTRRGTLLKHQVPIRTFADWNDERPGFVEADLVAHCGCSVEGAFLHTLVLTDIATGWTECLALPHRSQEAVLQALTRARRLLPFPLRGLDTDNGSEFLNAQLVAYCQSEEITFTRGRAYKKNDQCFVEQKNGVIVRQLVGYDRYEGRHAYEQLTELYRAVRLYVNFFQPSMKLREKHRDGAKVNRQYDPARTPYQRLLAAGVLADADRERLLAFYGALDPVRLLRQLERLQDALWRHARVGEALAVPSAPRGELPLPQVFDHMAAQSRSGSPPATPEPNGPRMKRKYRRSGKPRVPRTWRTHPDAFAEVWGEVKEALALTPELTAKALFQELQVRYPGRFPAGQLRTLQRRVKEWRAQALLQFNDAWVEEEIRAGAVLPQPLRAVPLAPPVATAAGVAPSAAMP